MANKYLDYAGLQRLVENINKKYAPISAIVFKSSVENLDSLPALVDQKAGFMYNVKVGGITTSDFVEGAGHIVADGENIAAVELYTGVYTLVAPAVDDDPKARGWYEVDTTTTYFAPQTPVSDPSTEGFFEFAAGVPVSDPSTEGFFEQSGVNFVASTDTTVDAGKTYYAKTASSDPTVNPSKTYYKEVTEVTYKLSQDRLPVAGKDYYEAETVMKWDLMGGVFDLEDRYLEFGDAFPQGPVERMIDGRTFLYMGDTIKEFKVVLDPEGRPVDNNYFELDSATPVTDRSTIFNPKQQGLYEACDFFKVTLEGTENPAALGLYEEDSSDPSGYVLTADTTVVVGKDYFKNIAGGYILSQDQTDVTAKTYYVCEFVASEDTTVDVSKIYYTESDLYKKAVIYQYDATNHDWIPQSNSGTDDMIPITNKEIDDLFI